MKQQTGRRRPAINRRVRRNRRIHKRKRPGMAIHPYAVNLDVFRRAGQQAGQGAPEEREAFIRHAFQSWHEHGKAVEGTFPTYDSAILAGKAFMEGYAHAAGRNLDLVPLLLRRPAAAVVCACNEEQTLPQVLRQLKRLPLEDIIVVLNGTKDNSLERVISEKGITIVYEPERAGHDVGRALGAKMTMADSVLFVDGDMVLPAEQLAPFLYEIDRGSDVALNDISSLIPPFARQDEVSRIKAYLNRTLGRPDLGSNSMTAVPHAVSRRMIDTVKPESLVVPPKAQTLAIHHGLAIAAPARVDVIRTNRLRKSNIGSGNEVAKLIIGDHLEALAVWLKLSEESGRASPGISRIEVAYRRNGR
ncbi:hypothetical protein PAECIP111890_01874 [Paenibacillus sp. JJ-223]|nr:hypothetical protein PAECIP111890_01874 [Paenibacillus sp. JJ-223]